MTHSPQPKRRTKMNKNGDLQVWHIPQVPGKRFEIEAKDMDQAKLIMAILADYDNFQFINKIKPDYCNAQGINRFEDGEWYSADEDTCYV